jgi:ATP-dependent Clp protease protease subunit
MTNIFALVIFFFAPFAASFFYIEYIPGEEIIMKLKGVWSRYGIMRLPRVNNMSYIPYVIEKVQGGERSYDLYSRLLKDRIIFLTEDVNHVTASSIVAQMLFLEAEDPDKDIFFYINSPGGSVSDGLAIYDTMKYIKCDVNTICVGMAASMGAFLLAGGTKGKRYALPNAEVMIHQPLGGTQGQASDMLIAMNHMTRTKEKLTRMLAENSGQTYEKVWQDTDRDNWLTAYEAKEYGLIDHVMERNNISELK